MSDNPYAPPEIAAEVPPRLAVPKTQVTFEATPEHILAFMEYQRRSSHMLRWLMILAIFVIAGYGISWIFPLWPFRAHWEALAAMAALVIVVTALVLLLPWMMRRIFRYVSAKMLAVGKNRLLTGLHIVTLTDEGVQSELELARGIYKWAAIEKILVTADYLLLFVCGVAALVIPKNAFQSDAEWRSFIDAARNRATDAEYVEQPRVKLGRLS